MIEYPGTRIINGVRRKVIEQAPETKEVAPKTSRRIHKSADSGKIVSEDFADANPSTTYETEVKAEDNNA